MFEIYTFTLLYNMTTCLFINIKYICVKCAMDEVMNEYRSRVEPRVREPGMELPLLRIRREVLRDSSDPRHDCTLYRLTSPEECSRWYRRVSDDCGER